MRKLIASAALLLSTALPGSAVAQSTFFPSGAVPGLGAVVTTSQSPTAADFSACKLFTINAGSLTVTAPQANTLQANGGCFVVSSQTSSWTLAPNAADKINGGTTGTSLSVAAGLTAVTTDGVNGLFTNAVGGGSGAVSSVANSDGTLTIAPTTGSVVASLNLAHANTWTAAEINSTTGAASTPAMKLTGVPYSAGNSTTNFPLFSIIENTATTTTSWSGGGTDIGVNHHGASGNLLDLQTDGSEVFTVGTSGQLHSGNLIMGQGFGALNFGDSPGAGSLSTPSATNGDFLFADNGGTHILEITKTGLLPTGTIPTVTGTGTPAITTGSTDTAGEITSGTSATSIVVHSADAAVTTAPFCTVTPEQAQTTFSAVASVSSSHWLLTITINSTSAAKFTYTCFKNGP